LLLELAEQFGNRTAEGVQITIKLSHQELSGAIGSTRESVTLLLGELQQEGLVQVARRRIRLTAPERLAKEIEFSPMVRETDLEPSTPTSGPQLVSMTVNRTKL
jgi:hypothetical protein